MEKFAFEALNTDGKRVKGVLEAESKQAAINKAKEQGLQPLQIVSVAKSPNSATEISDSVKHARSYGWKIRFAKLLFFYLPFLVVAASGFYLFSKWSHPLPIFLMEVVGLFVLGFAGFAAEQKLLNSFTCPDCHTLVEDWDFVNRRAIYSCKKCQTKWDIGYKQRSR